MEKPRPDPPPLYLPFTSSRHSPWHYHSMKALLLALACSLPLLAGGSAPLPEPGPENSGLRMRVVVKALADKKEGFDVRLDLLNTSGKPVTLTANWIGDREGSLRDYLAAALSIETFPAIKPWMGGVMAPPRNIPQPTKTVEPGKAINLKWQTKERKLKIHVSNPNDAQNPSFPFPGLYSVHATLTIKTDKGIASLRSNEQLVSVGGSKSQPKSTHGELWHVSDDVHTATLGLGTLHQVKVGDVFEYHSKRSSWWLTITSVDLRSSRGQLECVQKRVQQNPERGMKFTLARKK